MTATTTPTTSVRGSHRTSGPTNVRPEFCHRVGHLFEAITREDADGSDRVYRQCRRCGLRLCAHDHDAGEYKTTREALGAYELFEGCRHCDREVSEGTSTPSRSSIDDRPWETADGEHIDRLVIR